ncbi:MAG: hypothetical protein AAFV69_00690 [Pseudomonadota bacterium]
MSVFLFAFGGIQWSNARRWRYLSENYAGTADFQIKERNLQSAVMLGLGGYNSLKGILTIGIHHTGVSLRILTPFSLFHSPLFVPFEDISGWKTSWYLDGESRELTFRRAPEVKMVMPAEQAEWIKSYAGDKMMLRDSSPVRGNAGRGWYAFAVINTGLSVIMVGWLLFYLLSQSQ